MLRHRSRSPEACALCLEVKPLIASHVVPRWAFARVRDAGPGGDPVVLQGGTAVQKSPDVTFPLLCAGCDQHLGKTDDYCARLAYADAHGTAPMSALLRRRVRCGEVFIADASALDTDALCRFAVSVFWRAHVARERGGQRRSPRLADVGRHAEWFRRYLSSKEVALPGDAAVVVQLYEDARTRTGLPFSRALVMPETDPMDGGMCSRFLVCGLEFFLVQFDAGSELAWANTDLSVGRARRVLVSEPALSPLALRFGELASAARMRGRLARAAPRRAWVGRSLVEHRWS